MASECLLRHSRCPCFASRASQPITPFDGAGLRSSPGRCMQYSSGARVFVYPGGLFPSTIVLHHLFLWHNPPRPLRMCHQPVLAPHCHRPSVSHSHSAWHSPMQWIYTLCILEPNKPVAVPCSLGARDTFFCWRPFPPRPLRTAKASWPAGSVLKSALPSSAHPCLAQPLGLAFPDAKDLHPLHLGT